MLKFHSLEDLSSLDSFSSTISSLSFYEFSSISSSNFTESARFLASSASLILISSSSLSLSLSSYKYSRMLSLRGNGLGPRISTISGNAKVSFSNKR
jgi:hypothetical protein